ncbi:abscisic acid 8'-hydroxylase 2 isoform X2 [Spinacia oleracea]|uniref:Abscisic acid 8'-hydroxylase 2 isoform X2 n=1 Tax=Spinacia oleracea TaxID=3562 RepID=A0ABM3R1G5_SPIOL|nr:abscisic acid 8'-hydroxylase 2 isoform X2 [Spinacia oleracea]
MQYSPLLLVVSPTNNPFLISLVLFLFSLVILITLSQLLCYFYPKHKRLQLPPGSMGWPYLGETLKLYTENPNSFFSNRQKRYGDIFKTHILGCPCVMISSPEAAKIVLVTKAHLFKPTYPPSKEKMIGPEALFFHQGDYHSKLKKLVQSSFLPCTLKASVSDIENIVLNFLPTWENNTINTLHEMKKARKLLNETLRKLIARRRKNNNIDGGLLGVLLGSREQKTGKNNELSDSQIADNVIGVIFAAHDTTASVLTWLLKYLHDNHHLLQAVTKEQGGIKQRLIEANRGLTWEDTRNMPLTSRVIQETLRTASILSFTFREAVHDVEFEGYLIPKGWKVLPLFRSIHHCAEFFPHPEKFDPSRFEVPPRPNTYMPFGNGVHSCPGSELAKLEMLIFLHHLTTTYRWEVVGDEDGIQYGPFPVPKRGFPIMVHPQK